MPRIAANSDMPGTDSSVRSSTSSSLRSSAPTVRLIGTARRSPRRAARRPRAAAPGARRAGRARRRPRPARRPGRGCRSRACAPTRSRSADRRAPRRPGRDSSAARRAAAARGRAAPRARPPRAGPSRARASAAARRRGAPGARAQAAPRRAPPPRRAGARGSAGSRARSARDRAAARARAGRSARAPPRPRPAACSRARAPRPRAGEVRVLGCRLPGEAWAVRGRIGLLGHEPLLYRELTARENLRFHARLHDVAAGRVEELLARVRLEHRADEPLRSLSRGMVQRVAVARAVLHDPELLLLDEPRSNLDPAAVELVDPLIGSASGRTRVICSHDPGGGLAEADVVLGLRDGRPALLRAAGELRAEEIVELYR